MKKLQEKNKSFIKELNECYDYDEKDIEEIFDKHKNNIDMLDVIKYFMRNKYKLIYQRDEYHYNCNDYEKAIDRYSVRIEHKNKEIHELQQSIYELGENYRNLKKAYNLLKNIK